MFDTVLVANRGEIACRVIRTLRRMGIRSVAVFSDADADAPHVRAADRRRPHRRATSSIPAVIDAARATGAQAIHPGYGFLSENTAFAAACEEAGIVFVGPPSSAIEAMGDKIRAKQTVAKAGVPVVPGSDGAGLDDAALALAVEQVGYPVLLKPSAGGGGKGMREVHRAADLADAIASARREARGSFGDDTLLVERLVTNPRHIEIQVLADAHGNAIHLGERECSLQRRHQKIIEEAPSPLLTDGAAGGDGRRGRRGGARGRLRRRGDGRVHRRRQRPRRVLLHGDEHPAAGGAPGHRGDLPRRPGRDAAAGRGGRAGAVALHPRRAGTRSRRGSTPRTRPAGFLPTGGRILRAALARDARVDAGVVEGGVVGSDYDPMLAKVIAWGRDRAEALRRLDAALGDTVLLGVGTNIGFLRALLADPDVRAGRLDTGLVGRRIDALAAAELPPDVLPAAAVHALAELEPKSPVVDPFDVPGGWRVGAPAWTTWRMAVAGHDPVEVRARGRAADAVVEVRRARRGRRRLAAGAPSCDRVAAGCPRCDAACAQRVPQHGAGAGERARRGRPARRHPRRRHAHLRRRARTATRSGSAATATPGPSASRARSTPWPPRPRARAGRCARRCPAR